MVKPTAFLEDSTRFLNISIWYDSVSKLGNLRNNTLFSVSQCFIPKPLPYKRDGKVNLGYCSLALWENYPVPDNHGRKPQDVSPALTTEFTVQMSFALFAWSLQGQQLLRHENLSLGFQINHAVLKIQLNLVIYKVQYNGNARSYRAWQDFMFTD